MYFWWGFFFIIGFEKFFMLLMLNIDLCDRGGLLLLIIVFVSCYLLGFIVWY